jgi:hypothetical protein
MDDHQYRRNSTACLQGQKLRVAADTEVPPKEKDAALCAASFVI